jgi:hypothetical protein
MIKSDSGDGSVVPFLPNAAQLQLLKKLWHRNIVLKARQRGITTLVAIMWLDHALFNADQRCGIIAQDFEAATVIFRDKVKLAYERLPDALRAAMPLKRDSAAELLFAHNNSSVRVATSMRSGTINRMHISEFGKICAKFPEKAAEVVTGSLPAVPIDGVIIIESTAEGRDGEFFAMSERSKGLMEKQTKLTKRDYRFHFFSWWGDENYRLDADFQISEKDKEYFDAIESSEGVVIDLSQRAWYVATRDSDFGGDQERMWQEYPSIPSEAFRVSLEGTYYATQLAAARKAERITVVPHCDGVPVNTFWDIGNSDGTAVWLHQKVGLSHRFIKFIEGWGEPYSYYITKLQGMGFVWGTHYLPHDAGHKRQQGTTVAAPVDMLRALSLGGKWEVVPPVDAVINGIQRVRDLFGQCWFDDAGTVDGINHLSAYRKTWNAKLGTWSDTPRHDIHSEAADAFRQFAQAFESVDRGNERPRSIPISASNSL